MRGSMVDIQSQIMVALCSLACYHWPMSDQTCPSHITTALHSHSKVSTLQYHGDNCVPEPDSDNGKYGKEKRKHFSSKLPLFLLP